MRGEEEVCRIRVEIPPRSLPEGLRTPTTGLHTFDLLNRRFVSASLKRATRVVSCGVYDRPPSTKGGHLSIACLGRQVLSRN